MSSNRVGTNGVFFQKDRNTVELDEMKISIIEDHMFSKVDLEFSNLIRDMREKPNNEALLSVHNQGMLNAFLIDLFWRNPITDYAFDDLYARVKITFGNKITGDEFSDEEREKKIKSDPVDKAFQRAAMTINSINEILKVRPQGNTFSKFWEFGEELLLIGDYPMLFEKTPETQTDLLTNNFFLPISSTRMYASINGRGMNFDIKDAHLFNALIIEQSTEMVCSPNNDLLEKCVKYHRALKTTGVLPNLKRKLFAKILDA